MVNVLHYTGQCHIISYPAQNTAVALPLEEILAELPPRGKTMSGEFSSSLPPKLTLYMGHARTSIKGLYSR